MYRNTQWDSSYLWELGWGRGSKEKRTGTKVTHVRHQYRWSLICDGSTYDFSTLQWRESSMHSYKLYFEFWSFPGLVNAGGSALVMLGSCSSQSAMLSQRAKPDVLTTIGTHTAIVCHFQYIT